MTGRQAIRWGVVSLGAMLASWNVAYANLCSGTTPPGAEACAGPNCFCLPHVAPACQPAGLVLDAFIKRGACTKFGKPLIPMRPRLSVGGKYQTFENGEIASYPNWTTYTGEPAGDQMSGFVLSGALANGKIDVEWDSTKPFTYEFFILRWDLDDHAEAVETQHKDDKQQAEINIPGTAGRYVIDAGATGTYVIYVEGCNRTGFIFKTADCRQGWSYPIYVDHLERLSFAVPIPPLPPPVSGLGILDDPDKVRLNSVEQTAIIGRLCRGQTLDGDGDHEGEVSVDSTLAQLQSVSFNEGCGPAELRRSPAQIRSDVNAAIMKAVVVSQPGTDVDSVVRFVASLAVGAAAGAIAGALLGIALTAVFGGLTGLLNYLPVIGAVVGLFTGPVVLRDKPGDYDMRLTGLLQIVYRFPLELDPSTRTKLIDDLLTVRGSESERKDFLWISGVPTPILETENHVWMTESARYLTNNLLVEQYKKNGQAVPSQFDNDANGMTDWVLAGLRLFLVQGFYENNSRPYATYVLAPIQNLADFASHGEFCLQVVPAGSATPSRKCDVARAARNVLDFLATKFAVSSNGLRRAAPFRRLPGHRDYPRLLADGGDDLAWHYLGYTGGSDFLRDEQFARLIKWDGSLLQAFQSSYGPPVMVTDLIRTTASGVKSPLQRFHVTRRDSKIVEIYYREPDFLISAGGKFDGGAGVANLTEGEDSWALPTTLMPTAQGNDYRDFVRIAGEYHERKRINTCVAPGFACGTNPVVPRGLPPGCTTTQGNWIFINFADNTPDCPFPFGFYVAVYRAPCKGACNNTFGFFEATAYRSFPAYMADVLAMNKGWSFEFDKINVYQSPTGRRVTFLFDADEKEWPIVDYDLGAGPVKPVRRFDQWPVADGDIMTTPQDACIMVDNQHLKQRLILDHTDVNHPRRTIVALPTRCTCPLPDHCISPRSK